MAARRIPASGIPARIPAARIPTAGVATAGISDPWNDDLAKPGSAGQQENGQ